MKLTCADPTCERAPMRTRDGQRWCMWHPDQKAPEIDLLSGKLRGPNGKPKEPKQSEILRPSSELAARPAYRTPGRVTPAARTTAPDDAPADSPRPPRVGRRIPLGPRNPVDQADAARRYLDGEPLFTLAADLHIGVNTLRRILTDQGVTLRKRGQVITPRDSHARPLDVQQCLDLYEAGHTTTQIAKQLRVATNRVQNALRVAGVLRPPGGRPPGAGAVNSVRLKLGADLSDQVRLRAAALGQPISHYLRDLVLADLTAAGIDLEQAS